MSKRGRSHPNDSTPPTFDEAGAYLADSGSDGEDYGGGSGSEACAPLALPDTSSFFAVPVMTSSASLFAPPPPLERTVSCHTSSPASSMAASPPSGLHSSFMAARGSVGPALLMRHPSNQSDSSMYSPVDCRDNSFLSHAPDHAASDSVQPSDPSQLAADNLALSQRLVQLEAELRILKPRPEHQQGFFDGSPATLSSVSEAAPVGPPTAIIGFTGVPVHDFTTVLQLPTPPSAAFATVRADNLESDSTAAAEFPFVFAKVRFGNEATLPLLGENVGTITESAPQQHQQQHQSQQQQQQQQIQEQKLTPYASSVEDLRALIKQQQKELDYFRHAHKSVVLQQGRQQLASVEKARADSAEALVLQLQQELSTTSSALCAAESALRSDAAYRSAVVKYFPDLASASAVIYRIQEMQQRQLQLEEELCAARKEAAGATAESAAASAQLSSMNAYHQQQQQQQQVLLQQLHKAEAAAAAAAAAVDARQSVVKMFDLEKFVEEKREIPTVKAEAEAAKQQQRELMQKLEAANEQLEQQLQKQQQQQQQILELQAAVADANTKAASAAAAAAADSASLAAASSAVLELHKLHHEVKQLKNEQATALAAAAEAREREDQLKKQLEDMQRKLDDAAAAAAASAVAASAAATPSAAAVASVAADSLVEGGDDEHKKRLREKAELKMQKLQKLHQEADQQAAAATAAAPSSGASPPHIFKAKKRIINPALATAPPATGISLSDIRQ